VGISQDIVVEHRLVANTMSRVGPEAPAGVGTWNVTDLAAHLLAQSMARGLVVFLGRSLVAKGIRLNDRAGGAAERTNAFYRRRGFESAIETLTAGVPRLLLTDRVGPVSLLEVWLHHDDVCRANNLDRPAEPATLGAAVDFALRYQQPLLGDAVIDRTVSDGELLRWLAGRPSILPSHEPALRF